MTTIKDIQSNSDKPILIIDGSYVIHVMLYSLFSTFRKKNLDHIPEASWNNDLKLSDYPSFTNAAENYAVGFLTRIKTIFQRNHIDYHNCATFFVLDCPRKTNWRKEVFTDYKAQRDVVDHGFNKGDAFGYILNLFKNSAITTLFGLNYLKHPNIEADDIIAILCRDIYKEHKKILIASDKDFLQLHDEQLYQYDIGGKHISLTTYSDDKNAHIIQTGKSFIVFKALLGDGSDNIPQVKFRYGRSKIMKIMAEGKLKEFLASDVTIFEQFKLNMSIMSFDNIPENYKYDFIQQLEQLECVLPFDDSAVKQSKDSTNAFDSDFF